MEEFEEDEIPLANEIEAKVIARVCKRAAVKAGQVLTPEEQQLVENATAAYNQTIEALATQYDLGLVDVNTYQNVIATQGAPLPDGSVVTDDFATGGGFSLDGIHPAPRGAALLANRIVETINAKYGSNLPGVNPLDYTGLYIR